MGTAFDPALPLLKLDLISAALTVDSSSRLSCCVQLLFHPSCQCLTASCIVVILATMQCHVAA